MTRVLQARDRQGTLGTVTLDDAGQLTGDSRALDNIIASFVRHAGGDQRAAFGKMAGWSNGYLWFTPPATITAQAGGPP